MKKIHMTIQCNACDKYYELDLDRERYNMWKNGEGLIQDLLSENTDDERELLLSGTCGECFDRMFFYKEDLL